LLAFVVLAPSAHAERTLSDEILENKYRWGDYAVYIGWHDPQAAQFDEHGDFAIPFGGKVRLRWKGPLRVEADFSYYRRSSTQDPFLLGVLTPEFDGVMLNLTLQAVVRGSGLLRPYVGGGPAMVSLSNDFVAKLDIDNCDLIPECRRLLSWKEVDLGLQAVAGVDIMMSRRVFPFLEYRHLFGSLDVGEMRDGLLVREPDEVVLVNGAPVPGEYDWSGPNLMAGLKIRF
jgi:hypothetical protein